MNPILREYLIYAVAVFIGWLAYLGLENGLGLDFSIAFFGALFIIHGAVLVGRRYF